MEHSPSSTSRAARIVEIDPGRDGQRIDNFLMAQLKGVPRSHVYRLLRTGQVRVNRGRIKPTYRLKEGDQVRIPPVDAGGPDGPPVKVSPGLVAGLAGAVLYEDDDLMILDKPAGVAVHGGSGLRFGLIEALRALRPDCPGIQLVHRLDRDTSGCLLVAKDRRLLPALQALFREDGRVEKRYLALVKGRWAGGGRTVDLRLNRGRLRSGERMVQVDADGGRAAVTRFIPQQRFLEATLVEARLGTGRTHQIRVHAAGIGHPLAGDDRYGDDAFNRRLRALGLKRIFLHAHYLGFAHPRHGQEVAVSCQLPENLKLVLDRIDEKDKNEKKAGASRRRSK
jgi:23S rRNA pseudouridine955/2504/2580 synthase